MNGILKIVIGNQTVELELCEPGYYGGETDVRSTSGVISMHVEAHQVNRRGDLVNGIYKEVLSSWMQRNEQCAPEFLTIGKKRFFIHIETYAE